MYDMDPADSLHSRNRFAKHASKRDARFKRKAREKGWWKARQQRDIKRQEKAEKRRNGEFGDLY